MNYVISYKQDSVNRALNVMPWVQAEILADSGHFISVDQAELVNDKIVEFVATQQMIGCKKAI